MFFRRAAAVLLSLTLLLFSMASCKEEPEIVLKPDLCEIPADEEALRAAVDACKHHQECYLTNRKTEEVGCFTAPDCAVLITKLVYGSGREMVTAYVADVYIKSMKQFVGYVCRTDSGKLTKTPAPEVVEETGCLLLINSDFLTARNWGLYIRAGEVIRDKGTGGIDLCTIGVDGKMQVFDGDAFDSSAAKNNKDLYHVFSFGPSLLNADGSPKNSDDELHITDKYSKWNNYESSVGFPVPNPRTAIGQAGDGHYVFVTVDGRMWGKSSRGVTLPELSHILYEEGAVVGYNLDGGGSEIMIFKGEELTRQYSEDAKRTPSDYILITSSGYTPK